MSGTRAIRYAATAALGALAILWGSAGAAAPPDAAEVIEVKVLEAQVPQGQEEHFAVLYRMEVLSVLRSASRVQPGETVTVRADGQSQATLEPGWIGTAYLNRDPKASGPDAGRQFVTAAEGEGLVKLPPGPPSLKFTVPAPAGGQ
jgi:hypothetical protein